MKLTQILDDLWGGEKLPAWDPDVLFSSFMLAKGGDRAAHELYARQMKQLIGIVFKNQRWMYRLPEAGLIPSDVASDLLRSVVMRIENFTLDQPCPKVLLKQLNTAFFRLTMSAIRSHSSIGKGVVTASVFSKYVGSTDPMDQFAKSETGLLSSVRSRVEAAEPEIYRGVPGNFTAVLTLVRYLRWGIFARATGPGGYAGTVVSFKHLPNKLRKLVCAEQHALIAARLRRAVAHAAGCHA